MCLRFGAAEEEALTEEPMIKGEGRVTDCEFGEGDGVGIETRGSITAADV